ncbi:MAG: cobalt transporter, inner rane subunit CbiQ [Bacillales bacterium]|jgi:cobalt/nickel transport system permease protein|nr:cobalt transporter, inner rane subunit CbiQ [Bacillales bacterium]
MKLPALRVRVLIGLILIILGVIPKSIPIILANLIFGFVILLCHRIPLRFVWKRFLFIIPFFVISAILLVFVEGYSGFLKAQMYTGRLLFVAIIMTFMMYKTSNEALIKSFQQLRVPSIFIELAFFTLRFMDVFKIEIQNMFLSIRSKGFKTGNFFSMKTVKIYGHLLGSMLVRSLQRSERIYLGMQSRGYSGTINPLENIVIPFRDWIHGGLLLIVLIVVQIFCKGAF